jgi:outer membrane lipoprotein-sorting protein
VNILRRLPLSRLLLLCGLVVAGGISITAIASALSAGPTPPPKPLAQAVHDALSAPQVQGVRARVTLTNHLLEGANLASGGGQGGEITSSPLVTGGSGRLWIAGDGRVRLELQAEQGDTQVISDGHTISIYDAASNTLYRYTPTATETGSASAPTHPGSTGQPPSVAQIENAISHISAHADLSGAQPADVAGRAAYTVRISPKEGGSLLGGAELSFDAAIGVPLRAAIYSSTSPSPVIELAATEVSYGPVDSSVFSFTPPASAKIVQIVPPSKGSAVHKHAAGAHEKPQLSSHGKGLATIGVLETKSKSGKGSSSELEGLPKVQIGSSTASELRTALGTILSFQRAGTTYVLAGSVTPAAIEALARGL